MPQACNSKLTFIFFALLFHIKLKTTKIWQDCASVQLISILTAPI